MVILRNWQVWMVGLLAVAFTGCGTWPEQRQNGGAYPADFAMVFTVEHDALANEGPSVEEPAEADPMRLPAQHLVLPDRVLRVAVGPGATHDYYPGVTARLSPEQMAGLYKLVEGGDLLVVPREAVELEPGALRYRLAITADGYRREYVTTPEQRPEAAMLLRRLVELRGGR